MEPNRRIVRRVRNRRRRSGQRLPLLERAGVHAQELALLYALRLGMRNRQGQSRLGVRGRGVRAKAGRCRRRVRGGCGAALPPVQQRADGRSEPPLHDEPGDPVDDAGAGVDRRGRRSRRHRLHTAAGPGGDHHGPGFRWGHREGVGVSRPQSQWSLRRERSAGLFGRRRRLSAHGVIELDGAARRRGDRRRLVPHVVSVANLRHRHHAVLDAGPAHWPEQLSSCRGSRPRAARRAAEIRRQADCATRGRVVGSDGDERDRDGLEVAWHGVRSHGPGRARLGGRCVPGRADRHAATANRHQEWRGDRLQGGLCRRRRTR